MTQEFYNVKQGDNLSKIAKAHQMSLRDLLALNGQIKNPDLIHIHEQIRITSPEAATQPPQKPPVDVKTATPPGAQPVTSPLVTADNGQRVYEHDTLISSTSQQRSQELLRAHPDRVIRYHVVDNQSPNVVIEGFRGILAANNLKPEISSLRRVNGAMSRAISAAVAQYNATGVVRLVRENDPAKADISIAAAASLPGKKDERTGKKDDRSAGVTSADRKFIALAHDAYRQGDSRGEKYIAVHELGHALGLEHPHNYTKDMGGPSTNRIACANTVMAYQNLCVGNNRMPADNLGKTDIAALKKLYAFDPSVAAATGGHGIPASLMNPASQGQQAHP